MFDRPTTPAEIAKTVSELCNFRFKLELDVKKKTGISFEPSGYKVEGQYRDRPFDATSIRSSITRLKCRGGLLWCAEIELDNLDHVDALRSEFHAITVATLLINSVNGVRVWIIVSAKGKDAVLFKMNYENQDRRPGNAGDTP